MAWRECPRGGQRRAAQGRDVGGRRTGERQQTTQQVLETIINQLNSTTLPFVAVLCVQGRHLGTL